MPPLAIFTARAPMGAPWWDGQMPFPALSTIAKKSGKKGARIVRRVIEDLGLRPHRRDCYYRLLT